MTPAEKIIKKCGGVTATAKIAGRTESVVHRWTYPRERGGTGGAIPNAAQIKILEAASRGEIDVRPEDFFVTAYHAPGAAA